MKDAMKLLCKLCLLAAFFVLAPPEAFAQTTAKGQVLDSNNEAIIGGTVVEKGNPKNATVTDFDGNFTLKLQKSKTVVVSYVGMKTAEVAAGPNMRVVLEDDNAALEEVVVVGYTSKARKDLTGSVGSISGAKLAVVPVTSAAEALQGKIAGVQITTVDGQPGADINIRVRGATSVTQSNDPLFIVDGFQVDNINDIPPTDIASIDVLKDASLTAIYGAKGGNGVVIVTTKSAQQGKVQVTFNGRLQTSHVSRTMDLMNTRDFVEYQYDRAVGSGGTRSQWASAFRKNFGAPRDINLYSALATNDWQDEVLGNDPTSYSANVTIGGGNESTRFNLSLTQSEDKGIILGSGVRRTNVNLKLNTKLAKNLEFTYNPKMTYRRDEGAGGNRIGSSNLAGVLRYRPTAGLRDWGSYEEMENAAEAQNFLLTNPVNDIKTNTSKGHNYNVVNQFALSWTPITGLRLRSEGNYNIRFREQQEYYGWLTSTGQQSVHQGRPVTTINNRQTESYTWTNTAAYDTSLKEVHNLSFLLGQEIYHSQYKENQQGTHLYGIDVDAKTALNNTALGQPYAESTYTKRNTPNRTASFFGQASYNYDHKYFLAGTFRADGSTKFAPGHQWGYFPSVSGAWVVSQEPFIKDNLKWIDQWKIRASYGLSGNNNINDDLWRFLYSSEGTGGPGFGEQTANGELYYALPSQYPNQEIKWETTIARNVAMDLSFFGGRLTITPEVYWNTTRDLLYQSPINPTSGYTHQMQNIGKVQNNGWELTINGDILRGKDYVLSANFTLGHNKMTVKQLNGSDDKLYTYNSRWHSDDNEDYLLEVGGEVGLMYGYVYDGLYDWDEFIYPEVPPTGYGTTAYRAVSKTKGTINGILVAGTWTDGYVGNNDNGILASSQSGSSTLPGKIKIKDLNGDGQITKEDKTVIGRTTPKWHGGFGLSGQYKDFDFSANFVYFLDFDVYNATGYALSSSSNKQYEFFNVYSKFAGNNRWSYFAPYGSVMDDGYNYSYEGMYMNTNIEGSVDIYRQMNSEAKYWNPADLRTQTMLSYFVEDGSFIRCSDVTVGYTLPKKFTQKFGVNKLRAYVSGSNLFILTNYSGFDPEIDIQSGLTPSMDYSRYPRARSFSFGLNVTF